MIFLRISIITTVILFGSHVYSQQTAVIADDGYEHAEMSVHPWGASHGLFFGAKVSYGTSGNLWENNNTIYATNAGQYSTGAFSMGYIANIYQ